jgi:integrase/recombinase XerC
MSEPLVFLKQAPDAIAVQTDALITQWLAFERMEGLSRATLDTYQHSFGIFVTWFKRHAPSQSNDGAHTMPTSHDIRAFRAYVAERYKPASVNVYLAAVRSFFRYLVNTGRIARNPATEIRGVKQPQGRKHKRDVLTRSEVLAVLETCDLETPVGTRDRAILTLMAYCALRTVEVYRANIMHLRTQGDRMILEVQGKGRLEADAFVVIPRAQETYLRAWATHRAHIQPNETDTPLFVSLSHRSYGGRLTTRAIRWMVKQRYREAGVVGERKTTHSLRHTAITTVIRQGGSLLQAQAMARHADINTTLGYVHEISRLDRPAEDLIDYTA